MFQFYSVTPACRLLNVFSSRKEPSRDTMMTENTRYKKRKDSSVCQHLDLSHFIGSQLFGSREPGYILSSFFILEITEQLCLCYTVMVTHLVKQILHIKVFRTWESSHICKCMCHLSGNFYTITKHCEITQAHVLKYWLHYKILKWNYHY